MNLSYLLNLKSKVLITSLMLYSSIANASSTAAAASEAPSNSFTLDTNTILLFVASLLLIAILVLGGSLVSVISFYRKKRKSNNSSKVLSLLLLMGILCSNTSMAQEATEKAVVATSPDISNSSVLTAILLLVIILEIFIIIVFAKQIKYFSSAHKQKGLNIEKQNKFSLSNIWERMNKFKPIEEEASIETGHEYDGIKELDNITPPWFIAGFVLSIIFAFVYMFRYHVFKTAPLQIEEYTVSVEKAKIQQEKYLKTQAGNIDENSVVMLDQGGIDAGKALYTTNCVACHGDKGQGGVGPNLTDKFWLHKGSLKDIFFSIKYGWPENGMKSWKEDFSPNQIAQLSSYVYTLHNTNVAGGKEAQGDAYEESATAADAPTDATEAPKEE